MHGRRHQSLGAGGPAGAVGASGEAARSRRGRGGRRRRSAPPMMTTGSPGLKAGAVRKCPATNRRRACPCAPFGGKCSTLPIDGDLPRADAKETAEIDDGGPHRPPRGPRSRRRRDPNLRPSCFALVCRAAFRRRCRRRRQPAFLFFQTRPAACPPPAGSRPARGWASSAAHALLRQRGSPEKTRAGSLWSSDLLRLERRDNREDWRLRLARAWRHRDNSPQPRKRERRNAPFGIPGVLHFRSRCFTAQAP